RRSRNPGCQRIADAGRHHDAALVLRVIKASGEVVDLIQCHGVPVGRAATLLFPARSAVLSLLPGVQAQLISALPKPLAATDGSKGNLAMGMTLAEKIVARAAGRSHVTPGEIVTCAVDLAMIHDSGGPRRVVPILKRFGVGLWDPGKVVLISDHYVPATDE